MNSGISQAFPSRTPNSSGVVPGSGQVTLLDTGRQRPTAQITVGSYPVAVAIAS